jgi:hypothetical protein
MSVAEIEKTRSNLIEWIESLSDTGMLSLLDGLRTSRSDTDWWDDLSEAQQAHINEGLNDIENGRAISANIFWDKLKKNG